MLSARSHRRARPAVLALTAAMVLSGAVAAGAATTPASTFSITGVDASTGATTSSGAAGATVTGHALDWTLNYRNTTGGVANVDIRDRIDTNHAYVPGTLRVPAGMAPRWSTDGGATFTGVEPAAGVDAVGALGANADGVAPVPVQPPATGFVGGNVGGDGYEALFIDGNIYNLHHHRPAGGGGALTLIDCHSKTTGARCPGYGASGTYFSPIAGDPIGTGPDTLRTPQVPAAFADQATGRIWFPVSIGVTNEYGVACADVRNGVSCGYTQLGTGAFPASLNGGGAIGSRFYAVDEVGAIHCFDTATATACAGLAGPAGAPAPQSAPNTAGSILQVFDDRYVFASTGEGDNSRDLICLDTSTGNACPGFPIRGYGGVYSGATLNTPLAPILSTTGAVTGICGSAQPGPPAPPWRCFDLTGAPVPVPFTQTPGTTVNWVAFGSITRIRTKLYFAETNAATQATYRCWDYAIAAPCAGFVPATTGAVVRAYTLRQDPSAPDCIWEVGDAGVFEVFSATFGGTECALSQAVVTADPQAAYCDGATGHVRGWRSLLLTGITAADYTGAVVTVTGIDGSAVPGWDARVFTNADQTIDLSSIPVTGNTARISVSVGLNGVAAGITATATVTFDGDPAQVCFRTRVGAAQCSATPPVSNDAVAVTTLPGGISDAPLGNRAGAAAFEVANIASACPVGNVGAQGPAGADLAVTKDASRSSISANGAITWTAKVTNNGATAASGAVLVDDPSLPVMFTLVSSTAGTCTKTAPVRCELGTIAPGATVTVTLVGRAREAGTLTNTARVSAAGGDGVASNNVAAATTRVTASVRLTKVADRTTLLAGGRVRYVLRASNPTGVRLARVRVCDRLPGGLAFVSAVPRATRSSGRYCWSAGALQAHSSTTMRITTRSLAGTGGRLTNVATVSASGVAPKTARRAVRVLGASARGGGVTG
jgi:uncharacterized repeat protein (TIGR01451 family)